MGLERWMFVSKVVWGLESSGSMQYGTIYRFTTSGAQRGNGGDFDGGTLSMVCDICWGWGCITVAGETIGLITSNMVEDGMLLWNREWSCRGGLERWNVCF